jgi:hypothetical protein
MVKIYVAGSWEERAEIKIIMEKLEAEGHDVLVDWTRHGGSSKKKYAMEDLEGVLASELFVLVNPAVMSRGKFIETGIALANGKNIYVIGKGEIGIFEHLGRCKHFDFIEELLELMRK